MYENQEKKRAKAINAAVGKAGTGNPQIAIEFEYLDEPGGITYYGALTDAAFEYTMKAIRAAGFVGDDLSNLASLCDGSAPEVILVVEPEEYPKGSGKFRTKVKFINSMGGLAMKDAIQGDELAAFARKMKGKILAYDRSAGAAKPAPRKASAPADDTGEHDPDRLEERARQETGGGRADDIPFAPFPNI